MATPAKMASDIFLYINMKTFEAVHTWDTYIKTYTFTVRQTINIQ